MKGAKTRQSKDSYQQNPNPIPKPTKTAKNAST
jgi:hypothetical protein